MARIRGEAEASLRSAREEMGRTISSLENRVATLSDALREAREQTARQAETLENRVVESDRAHAEEIAVLHRSHAEAARALREQLSAAQDELAAAQRAREAEVLELRASHDATINAVRAAASAEAHALKQQLGDAKDAYARETAELKATITRLLSDVSSRSAMGRAEAEAKTAKLQQEHYEALDGQRRSYEAQLKNLRDDLTRVEREWVARLAEAEALNAQRLQAARDEASQAARAATAELARVNDDFRKQLAVHEAEHAEVVKVLTQERAAALAQARDELNKANSATGTARVTLEAQYAANVRMLKQKNADVIAAMQAQHAASLAEAERRYAAALSQQASALQAAADRHAADVSGARLSSNVPENFGCCLQMRKLKDELAEQRAQTVSALARAEAEGYRAAQQEKDDNARKSREELEQLKRAYGEEVLSLQTDFAAMQERLLNEARLKDAAHAEELARIRAENEARAAVERQQWETALAHSRDMLAGVRTEHSMEVRYGRPAVVMSSISISTACLLLQIVAMQKEHSDAMMKLQATLEAAQHTGASAGSHAELENARIITRMQIQTAEVLREQREKAAAERTELVNRVQDAAVRAINVTFMCPFSILPLVQAKHEADRIAQASAHHDELAKVRGDAQVVEARLRAVREHCYVHPLTSG